MSTSNHISGGGLGAAYDLPDDPGHKEALRRFQRLVISEIARIGHRGHTLIFQPLETHEDPFNPDYVEFRLSYRLEPAAVA